MMQLLLIIDATRYCNFQHIWPESPACCPKVSAQTTLPRKLSKNSPTTWLCQSLYCPEVQPTIHTFHIFYSTTNYDLPSLKKPGREVTINEALTAVRLRVMRPGSFASRSDSDAFKAVFKDTDGITESANCFGARDPVFERVTTRRPSDMPINTEYILLCNRPMALWRVAANDKVQFPALRMQRNAHYARFYAKNATYTRSRQSHGRDLSRDMACVKSEHYISLARRFGPYIACVKPCLACIRLKTVLNTATQD